MELANFRDYEAQKRDRDVFVIDTDYGEIVILPLAEAAKNHVRKFTDQINLGFYDGLAFHHIEPGKLIQGGDVNSRDDDPSNDGSGDPGYFLDPEIKLPNLRGSVGLAHPPGETTKGNSQFYILLADEPNLNGRYTVFGTVVQGLDVVDKISRLPAGEHGQPLKKVVMKRVYIEKRFV
ncbi:MAG: hypothetical protein A3F83_07860 [Candidatus Glassbacteria bacterium RIFCSPLOWO2_12_FULL_58_11]|uniref:Peptidyl-prolyl cis-trans isomerase n=1 Tax=Candidatus Glassbacteria bacterium RIFCSPLOWO2_12_FULL_58_11 TaxID=1817867 RepID=A0A1F5YZ98_9BACT|nr:MAG: hypothetical protein A3F83_07860 [Candidatus Glassbacteria bacterium RIFCSPLOWO2_12_FULL_58_11]